MFARLLSLRFQITKTRVFVATSTLATLGYIDHYNRNYFIALGTALKNDDLTQFQKLMSKVQYYINYNNKNITLNIQGGIPNILYSGINMSHSLNIIDNIKNGKSHVAQYLLDTEQMTSKDLMNFIMNFSHDEVATDNMIEFLTKNNMVQYASSYFLKTNS